MRAGSIHKYVSLLVGYSGDFYFLSMGVFIFSLSTFSVLLFLFSFVLASELGSSTQGAARPSFCGKAVFSMRVERGQARVRRFRQERA